MNDMMYKTYAKKHEQTVIHVGYPKTGTSFLQLEVFPKLQNDKLCIISDESLIGRVFKKDTSDMGSIALMLKKLYPDAKIIIGTRGHKTMLKSLHCQYVKEGGYFNYDDFVKLVINMERFDYKHYIKFLKKLFGEDNVWLYHFEDFQHDVDKVINDICEFIGCTVPSYNKNNKYAVRWNDRQIWLCRMAHRFKWFYKPRFWIDTLNRSIEGVKRQ